MMKIRALVLWFFSVALLLPNSTDARGVQSSPLRLSRATDDGHGHGDEAELASCTIDERRLKLAFNEVAVELNLTGSGGDLCSLAVPECHHEEDEDEDDHDEDGGGHHDDEDAGSGVVDSQCIGVYDFCKDLLVHTNLTADACLDEECIEDPEPSPTRSKPTSAQAYGYGFLMITLVSLASLLGVIIVPLISNEIHHETVLSPKALVYKYVYSFMIALGTSALICDAILHLIPHAWNLHQHEDEADDGHAHSSHGKAVVEDFLWKGTIILLAVYAFYLLEYVLHSFSGHSHSHGVLKDTHTLGTTNGKQHEVVPLDTSVSHGQYKEEEGSIVNPAGESEKDSDVLSKNGKSKGVMRFFYYIRSLKPLVWLIVIGDGLHNFADGLALGAAITRSLGLGLSTAIALLFHEIPHEFGDYVILISTGITWYSALLFNLASAIPAILGFFIGAAAGTRSEEANTWILAFAAGLFIYIALVDLLPQLIHAKKSGGRHSVGLLLIENLGFFISFIILFVIAIYEEDLNNLID